VPEPSAFADLHSHTNESDGSFSPRELIELAVDVGLAALAITDHDTFCGYDLAVPFARKAGLDLMRGIELNSKFRLTTGGHRYIHMLAYFPSGEPGPEFSGWLNKEAEDRRERNRQLAENLQRRGIQVTLEEVQSRGKSLAGRVHFAKILLEKGYTSSYEEAFQKYLGEGAPTYVERHSQTTELTIERIRKGNGIPVVAHPVRLSLPRELEEVALRQLKDAGLLGLEIYHSDHPPELQAHYRQLAKELALLPTGGSDFHGAAKPDIRLGTGYRNNIRVPLDFVEQMRQFVQ
jgi:3',5'-nucleoside bisphosphate phosphatase